ncbi:MAG TPA: hypothetical protein PLY87_06025 [Planctomycetaceae bacterium]|nr:hypothetical protein [Planctomycetaceae bacterium]HQZ64611.1 hypothetical protein [Planctomycetaceae bacterium]
METENDTKAMTTSELTHAVRLLMEREESRVAQESRKKRLRIRRRHKEMQASEAQLKRSIEVIKWCIVGIATVIGISLLIPVVVVWKIGNEAERIKSEVQEIKGEAQAIAQKIELKAELIRDKIQHPLQTIGGAMGGQLEKKIGIAIGRENE